MKKGKKRNRQTRRAIRRAQNRINEKVHERIRDLMKNEEYMKRINKEISEWKGDMREYRNKAHELSVMEVKNERKAG